MTRTAWIYCMCPCHYDPTVTHVRTPIREVNEQVPCPNCDKCVLCQQHIRGSMEGHKASHRIVLDDVEAGIDTPVVKEIPHG